MIEFRFVELLKPKVFYAFEKSLVMHIINIFDLNVLKCELKSVYAADFANQSSSIQADTEIIRELEINQALAEVTKLLRLILNSEN